MQASLLDTNLWLALTFEQHPHHHLSGAFLDTLGSQNQAAFCISTEQSFLRLATSPSILTQYRAEGLTNHDAIGFLNRFHQTNHIIFLEEPPGTRDLWLRLADRPTSSPKLWMDAYLAAFAITGNLRFVTFDAAFRQFQPHGLRLHLLSP